MNTPGGFATRNLLLGAVLLVLSTPAITLSQWDVKWHSTQSKDVTGCEIVQSGHFDNTRLKSVVALLSEKTGDELAIIDGATGETKWKSEQYFKIFRESVHITDVDGDGKDEIVFAAQNTPKSTVAVYMIAASGKSFTESPHSDPPAKQAAPPVQAASSQSGSAHNDPPAMGPAVTAPTSSASAPPAATPAASDPPRTLQADAAADISYQVAAPDSVLVEIYNGTGDLVRTLVQTVSPAGGFTKTWDGTDDKGAHVAVGPYFYTVTVGKTTATRKKVIFR